MVPSMTGHNLRTIEAFEETTKVIGEERAINVLFNRYSLWVFDKGMADDPEE